MKEIRFGDIQNYVLLGGGTVLWRWAQDLRSRGHQTAVYSSSRNLESVIPAEDRTLQDCLTDAGIPWVSCERIAKAPGLDAYPPASSLFISFGAPWIFKPAFIARCDGHLLNVHGAPLPEHRGAGGFSWRILTGDRRGTHLIHLVDGGIDTGAIVKRSDYEFPETCRTPGDYEAHHQEGDLEFLREFAEEVASGRTFPLSEQDGSQATYFPRLYTPVHAPIDWSWAAPDIVRFIQAFDHPYPGAFSELGGERVVLRDARLADRERDFHPFQAGLIYRVHADRAYVASGTSGGVSIGLLENSEGENRIGERLVGHRLVTPAEWLGEAKAFRAVYRPSGLVR